MAGKLNDLLQARLNRMYQTRLNLGTGAIVKYRTADDEFVRAGAMLECSPELTKHDAYVCCEYARRVGADVMAFSPTTH